MRRLILSLDPLPALRDAAGDATSVAPAAATLAELAGVDAVRLSTGEDLRPVSERDVLDVRRAVRHLELCVPVGPTLLKLALEARPDRVLLAGGDRDGGAPTGPLDLAGRGVNIGPTVRALAEAGIEVGGIIAPDVDSVKAAHAEGLTRVEFYTGAVVDLPAHEGARERERLSDAGRVAAKLRMMVGVGGGLDYSNVTEVLEIVSAADSVAVGRAAIARAVLVGIDRAVRDLRDRLR